MADETTALYTAIVEVTAQKIDATDKLELLERSSNPLTSANEM